MWYARARKAMLAAGAALALCGSPRESQAIFDLFHCNWFHRPAPVATYAPAYAPCAPVCAPTCAPACAPCPTTCNYVPQTCYRTVYRLAPVTSCQAVSGCDPCTGCPVTVMRPVTTYALRPQLIPYTTYRIVPSCNPCPSPCPTPCVSYPSSCGPSSISSGCSSCTVSAPSATGTSSGTMSAPALPSGGGAPLPGPAGGTSSGSTYPSGVQGPTSNGGGLLSPAPGSSSSSYWRDSYRPGSVSQPAASNAWTLPSEPAASAPAQPAPSGRSTAYPRLEAPSRAPVTLRQASYERPLYGAPERLAPARPVRDADGWELAR